jgi:hypothetical protein
MNDLEIATQESGVDETSPTPLEKANLEKEAIIKHISQSKKAYYQSGFGKKLKIRRGVDLSGASSSGASAQSASKIEELSLLVHQQQQMLEALTAEREREKEERAQEKRTQDAMAKQIDALTKFLQSNGVQFPHNS